MTEENLNPIVYSKNTIEFVTVANEFCSFIENAGSEDARTFLSKSQKILPLLYLKASVLPEFGSTEELMLEKFVSEVDYNFLLQRIMNLMGEHDDFQEVFMEEMQLSDGPMTSSISENLADIYQDLKDFILSYRIGDDEIMQEALWECIENFKNYWGQKLVNSLRAIHALVYSNIDFDQKLEIKSEEDETISGNKPDWLNDMFENKID